jgi:hypothetical protein
MNHRFADCQNSDPDDLGDCACMGTRSDLIREIHDLEENNRHLREALVKAEEEVEELRWIQNK